jgi:hypothetical protein
MSTSNHDTSQEISVTVEDSDNENQLLESSSNSAEGSSSDESSSSAEDKATKRKRSRRQKSSGKSKRTKKVSRSVKMKPSRAHLKTTDVVKVLSTLKTKVDDLSGRVEKIAAFLKNNYCRFCRRPGHTIRDCRKRKAEQAGPAGLDF